MKEASNVGKNENIKFIINYESAIMKSFRLVFITNLSPYIYSAFLSTEKKKYSNYNL